VKKFIADLAVPLHLKPEFIIIGAQKAGTTSLYDYLVQHPCVAPARTKEVHFFDHHFARGMGWYARRFPTKGEAQRAGAPLGHPIITGEASPFYLYHPHAPRRIRETLPQAKLIVLLRNPVDRAYSHYGMNVSKKTIKDPLTGQPLERETLSFEDAIAAEEERLRGEWEKMVADENYRSISLQLYSYKARGLYLNQLQTWLEHFPREQLLVLNSEEFAAQPGEVFARVLEYLNLPSWQPQSFERSNEGRYTQRMDAATRAQLLQYFRPRNEKLYQFLGTRFNWNS
jgi:hypothetical protein